MIENPYLSAMRKAIFLTITIMCQALAESAQNNYFIQVMFRFLFN